MWLKTGARNVTVERDRTALPAGCVSSEQETMWVGTEFPGDTNETLKEVQFRLYGDVLGFVFGLPRRRYLDACDLVQAETELAIRLRPMIRFDHRTLQDAHDLIAAWFRFSRDNGGQLRLGETDSEYQERLAKEWWAFSQEEIAALTSDDEFTRAVVSAAGFGNTDRGYAAEARLRAYLGDRYSAMKPRGEPVDAGE